MGSNYFYSLLLYILVSFVDVLVVAIEMVEERIAVLSVLFHVIEAIVVGAEELLSVINATKHIAFDLDFRHYKT